MSIDDLHRHPLPGTPEYDEHVREEIEHYGRVYEDDKARETLMQPVPPSWTEVEIRCAALIRAQTGNDEVGHVAERLAGRDGARLLSLGCGPGGVEIVLAQHAPTASFVCVDLNPDLLTLGRQRAAELALNVEFAAADLNTVELPRAEFDIVFCHAALHHVIELERLAEQMRCALKAGG